MKFKIANRYFIVKYIALFFILFSLIIGCAEFNDNPAEKEKTISIDIQELQRQVGYSTDSTGNQREELPRITGPGDSDATNDVKSIVVGAIVVTSRDTPYSEYEAITDEEWEVFKDEIANSIGYISFVHLPTSEDTIEFSVPPPSAGNWQIFAVGIDFRIDYVEELGEDKHDDAIIYRGFAKDFYTSETIEGETPELTLRRACVTNENIKGCATYSNDLNDDPIVTAAVEIIDVKINNVSVDPNYFPIIVRTEADSQAAVNTLKGFRDSQSLNVGDTLTVIATHSKNPNESSDCRAYADDQDATVSDLKDNCETQEYTAPITE